MTKHPLAITVLYCIWVLIVVTIYIGTGLWIGATAGVSPAAGYFVLGGIFGMTTLLALPIVVYSYLKPATTKEYHASF